MAVTLEDLKAHIRDLGDEDDALLTRKLAVATDMIKQKVGGFDKFDGSVPAPIEEAILMYAAHLYANREATTFGGQAFMLPLGVEDLISTYRDGWTY
ncbi:head-tail connector protein [Xanthobacter autotrophicus]|uniref:head-tail connector protein n=1 Tax=Xanthobacter TaxID=279 RepID=UPI0024AA5633|nr:head-tail connector protein [Xanthobacter autotrophicus]MDI4664342.1 head-tail connector protein [Xanthobacter autotrophicus]